MAEFRDHGILAVGSALAVMTGMDVHIGHDTHFQSATFCPDQAELATVELDDAIGEAIWIDVVVVEEVLDSSSTSVGVAEKEGTALAPASGSPFQFLDALVPDAWATNQLRGPAESRAQQRWK